MKKHYSKAIIFTAILASGPATAGTTTTTIDVTANVAGVCTVSADAIAFGEVDDLSTLSISGDVTVNCSTGTSYLVGMDAGQNLGAATTGLRAMTNTGGDAIGYDILRAAQQWGDNGIAGGNFAGAPASGVGIGSDQIIGFTGNLGSGFGGGNNVYTVGTNYSDVVTVTVQF